MPMIQLFTDAYCETADKVSDIEIGNTNSGLQLVYYR